MRNRALSLVSSKYAESWTHTQFPRAVTRLGNEKDKKGNLLRLAQTTQVKGFLKEKKKRLAISTLRGQGP